MTDCELILPFDLEPNTPGWYRPTTVAEPALIALSLKAGEVSGWALDPWSLRVAVGIGVALGAS